MKRVTGIGGIFFKSDNPSSLFAWYEKHLGIQHAPDSPTNGTFSTFEWRDADEPETKGMPVWSVFPRDSGTRIELWEPPKQGL